ncbi:MAG: class I SAM-dependent methyltransferase [Bryobacteraceae bacterium]|jgi:acetylserotonin N-methyltransferase
MTIPDPDPIIDLMEGFRRSKAMFAAVSLGVFDLLAESPLDAPSIAALLGTNPDATERLLEACAGLHLLENHHGQFANAPLADVYLRRSSERALTGYILYSNLALYRLWEHLEDAVREGTPRWEQTFGWPAPIFEHFFSTPEMMHTFLMAMHGLGVATSPDIVRAFDLSRFHTIADLGSATGHLPIAACQAWPQLYGIVFDMAKILPVAREQIEKSGLSDRITLHAGDFFTDPLPAADLYALGRVLHDWPEEKIRLLLRRIFDHLPPGGGLLIAEKLIHEDRSGPVGAQLQSLSMLVCTEGRERSLSEYRALLTQTGFTVLEGKRTGKYLDAILALK